MQCGSQGGIATALSVTRLGLEACSVLAIRLSTKGEDVKEHCVCGGGGGGGGRGVKNEWIQVIRDIGEGLEVGFYATSDHDNGGEYANWWCYDKNEIC